MLQVGGTNERLSLSLSLSLSFGIDALLTNAALTFGGGEILMRRRCRRFDINVMILSSQSLFQ